MFALLDVPVAVCYHLVSALAAGLAVPFGGAAAAVAIVVFTMAVRLLVMPLSYYALRGQTAQARLAPKVNELRRRYAGQPERMQHEITALYHDEGIGMFSGCLPLLVQAPFLSVMYLLFRSPAIGGTANHLLSRHLFGAALGSHWLSGAGPLSSQGVVFLGVFALLALIALIGWLSARRDRRSAAVPADGRSAAVPADGRSAAAPREERAQMGAFTPLAALMPFVTVAVAAFLPLAAGVYLVTSTAWTLAERALLRRKLLCRRP